MAVPRPTKAEKRQARKVTKTKPKTTATQSEASLPPLTAKNLSQSRYLSGIQKFQQIFALGPAGAGKTYIATHYAVKEIIEERCKKFIVARPMISSDKSENIGFLPGDLNMKFTPWAIPILDVIERLVGKVRAQEWLRKGIVEFAPFQFMRGRTFGEDTIVLLDEAQNCTIEQLRLFVTRLGDCKAIISGDPQQVDIRNSGLERLVAMAQKNRIEVSVCTFRPSDIVRSKICQEWVEAFSLDTEVETEHSINFLSRPAPNALFENMQLYEAD